MSEKLTQLLQDLRTAVLGSGSESEAVRAVLAAIREQGLSVYLVVDDPSSDQEPEALRLAPEVEEASEHPVFRIDQADLGILRGLGIDPTRTLRRRRRARRK